MNGFYRQSYPQATRIRAIVIGQFSSTASMLWAFYTNAYLPLYRGIVAHTHSASVLTITVDPMGVILPLLEESTLLPYSGISDGLWGA